MTQNDLDKLIGILKSECRDISIEVVLNPDENTNPKELAIWGVYQLAERIATIGLNYANQMQLSILNAYLKKYA
jgi:hypothetical protein